MNKRCVIITGYIEGSWDWTKEIIQDDFVMCADAGYGFAKEKNIKTDLLIGDFDSYEGSLPDKENIEIIKVSAVKDDTDTGLCVKEAIKRNFSEILLIGGVGGRVSHTLANIQTMAYAAVLGKRISLVDGTRKLYVLSGPDSLVIPKPKRKNNYLSLFAHGGDCEGVSVCGVFYPLESSGLKSDYPLGCSNVITGDRAIIKIERGVLIVTIE